MKNLGRRAKKRYYNSWYSDNYIGAKQKRIHGPIYKKNDEKIKATTLHLKKLKK